MDMSFVRETLQRIQAARQSVVEGALCRAAFFFEKRRLAIPLSKNRRLAIRMGWPREVVRERVTESKISEIEEAIIKVFGKLPPRILAIAIAALGQLRNEKHIGLLRNTLRRHLRDSYVVYAFMQALSEVGEEPFGDRNSRSILDVSENRRMAERYLARVPRVPRGSGTAADTAGLVRRRAERRKRST